MSTNNFYRLLLSGDLQILGEIMSPEYRNAVRSLPPDVSPGKLLLLLKQHRLFPVFNKIQRELPDTESWTVFRENLKQLVFENQLQMLHKTAFLAKLTRLLEQQGVRIIAIKGPVLSKMLHNDFASKASIDIDILIDEQQWEQAVQLLINEGFAQIKYHYELSPAKKRYLKNHFHHLGFFHPRERIVLEMHWQLNTNKYLFEYNFEELYHKAAHVEVGGDIIRTPDPVNTVVHLMVHGMHHAWCRLDWLYEFGIALQKYDPLYPELEEICRKLGLERLLRISTRLSNIVFHTRFPEYPAERGDRWMIQYCIEAVNNAFVADYRKPVQRFGQKFFLARFKKDLRYKWQVWLALRTNLLDWEHLRFPDRLFFLYYLVRPVMAVYYIFKK